MGLPEGRGYADEGGNEYDQDYSEGDGIRVGVVAHLSVLSTRRTVVRSTPWREGSHLFTPKGYGIRRATRQDHTAVIAHIAEYPPLPSRQPRNPTPIPAKPVSC